MLRSRGTEIIYIPGNTELTAVKNMNPAHIPGSHKMLHSLCPLCLG